MPAHRTCTKSYATYAAGSDTSCALTEIKHEKCSSWQQAAGSSCTCCCCYCGSCSANWQPATATGQKQLNMLTGWGMQPCTRRRRWNSEICNEPNLKCKQSWNIQHAPQWMRVLAIRHGAWPGQVFPESAASPNILYPHLKLCLHSVKDSYIWI